MAEAGSGAWHGARDVAAARASDVARQQRTREDVRAATETFYYDLGTHLGDILMVLANFSALFNRECRQFLPASCFKVFGFHGQHLKVSAVALQLQSLQNPLKINEKSRLHRGCVFRAFWGVPGGSTLTSLGAIFVPFSL